MIARHNSLINPDAHHGGPLFFAFGFIGVSPSFVAEQEKTTNAQSGIVKVSTKIVNEHG